MTQFSSFLLAVILPRPGEPDWRGLQRSDDA